LKEEPVEIKLSRGFSIVRKSTMQSRGMKRASGESIFSRRSSSRLDNIQLGTLSASLNKGKNVRRASISPPRLPSSGNPARFERRSRFQNLAEFDFDALRDEFPNGGSDDNYNG
jgi:hypothetical protein